MNVPLRLPSELNVAWALGLGAVKPSTNPPQTVGRMGMGRWAVASAYTRGRTPVPVESWPMKTDPDQPPGPRHAEAMSKWRGRAGALAVLPVMALLAAACGSAGSSHAVGASASRPRSRPPSATLLVSDVHNAKYGMILVDSSGRTLYVLTSAQPGACTTSACTSIWPPLYLPSGVASPGKASAVGGALGVVSQPGGMRQVTYNGYPLYRYAGDSGPGQANGEDVRSFGGIWSLASAGATTAATTPVILSAPASPSTSSSAPSTTAPPPVSSSTVPTRASTPSSTQPPTTVTTQPPTTQPPTTTTQPPTTTTTQPYAWG